MHFLFERAVIYASVRHKGKTRKIDKSPYILHPMEVAQILSTMTDDREILAAGVLHDAVEDTNATLTDIRVRFGRRVADLVASETENKYPDEDRADSWDKRKKESLAVLKNSTDIGVKMLWLADKLANIRSLARAYSEQGEKVWETLNQKSPAKQRWYYRTIAEYLELELNKTGAYKELIRQINAIWPGTFASEKEKFKNYRTVSVEGCSKIGRGAKGDVYRYDEELIIKVYNRTNTYAEVEREIALSRRAFIKGLPTAISFGIVSVGDSYGAMYELIDAETVSKCISRDPGRTHYYAALMANLAHQIHDTEGKAEEGFLPAKNVVYEWIDEGIAREDEAMAQKCRELADALPDSATLIHGDFHTGNVFLQNGEPVIIDLDRMSCGHPIIELSGVYMAYVAFGEKDPRIVEDFMGFSYETSLAYFRYFMETYLDTKDEDRIREVTDKAALLCYLRLLRKVLKKGRPMGDAKKESDILMQKTAELLEHVDTLSF